MALWPPPSFSEIRLKIKYYQSCSSSETSGEKVIVCEDTVLVRVTTYGVIFPYDNVSKAEIDKMLLTRINKRVPMNMIVFLQHGNIYRTTMADIN